MAAFLTMIPRWNAMLQDVTLFWLYIIFNILHYIMKVPTCSRGPNNRVFYSDATLECQSAGKRHDLL